MRIWLLLVNNALNAELSAQAVCFCEARPFIITLKVQQYNFPSLCELMTSDCPMCATTGNIPTFHSLPCKRRTELALDQVFKSYIYQKPLRIGRWQQLHKDTVYVETGYNLLPCSVQPCRKVNIKTCFFGTWTLLHIQSFTVWPIRPLAWS